MSETPGLLNPAEIRAAAAALDLRPTKKLGQNFVHDANTVRRIVERARVDERDTVLEVGPGLGSLTLGLLAAGARVVAVEVDPVLAGRLPDTVAAHAPAATDRLTVLERDALRLRSGEIREAGADTPTTLVANLPYNVAVPVVLHLLAELPGMDRALVMVQTEVAERMAAGPGSRVYGVPSVKLAWYGRAGTAGAVPRSVFWPVPNVDSALVAFERYDTPPDALRGADRDTVFALVDAAFAQRRKTLRAALAGWAGSAARAADLVSAAGLDPSTRGERLTVEDFAAIAAAAA
ncbi:16S rRNA (adenine(1518)-N(6)/adenine(1519)-N(6))-dimethyltransferase RsmA [Saccharomonospora iraqiensis]|uniref:16S rRNA (adenine(1518)-N(6)/adenine(1519)-N(6))- dimethyltransferase RsmA n=1 Tax=Saccharomonospora iraqiensis TaxID=52698 RepID=UPI00041CBCC1|nr:16S rRNA (adenine(1518)-N(6)/adenine(1519)-N(6))-dimethyltransferase RsmA [Saccharomonospora iraqiensis]